MKESAQKIRVCFVSLKAYPIFNPAIEKVFGGAEVDLYLLATALAKDPRFDVQFVVGDYGQPGIETIENVTLVKSLDVDKNMILQGQKYWRALLKADADIYLQEACSLGTAMVSAFCAYHRRKFVYRTAHTDETDGTYLRTHCLRGKIIKRAILKSDVFITQNEKDVENTIRTIGRKPCVIRNACRLKTMTHSHRSTILWVARSVSFKRPDLFLRLANAFPQKQFLMICPKGSGDTQYTELLKEAETVSNLTFIRRVPFHEIDGYFEQAALFVNTSDSEGFPNTFVQAAKSGTPILSLRVNPDDFLNVHDCGRCAEGNWERFCDLLREMTETPLGEQLGRNGLSYIKQYHDIDVIIEDYKRIFTELVNG